MFSLVSCFFKNFLIIFILTHNVNGKFEEVFRWKQMAYDMYHSPSNAVDSIAFPDAFPSQRGFSSMTSLGSANYIPYNNVPMGVTHYKGKLFITIPRRRPGIPATLNFIDLNQSNGPSPRLSAYPSYKINEQHPQNLADPSRIISVYRTRLDVCNFLWFIDTGLLEYPNNRVQVQRPSIWVIDLVTNTIVKRFEIPESIVQLGNGLASITVDVKENDCLNAYAYIPDLATYHLYVYSLQENRIWSFSHNYFHFDPLHGDFNIAGNEFQWDDGIFSITLGAIQSDGYRTAYFHPMVGISEFGVSTRYLRNVTQAARSNHGRNFVFLGMRGPNTQSAMHDYDPRTGIIFYSQVAINGASCWNTATPFSAQNHAVIDQNNELMIYPSDLNVDQEGSIWMMTNTMPVFIYSRLDPNVYNFRVWRQSVSEAVRGTVCGRSVGTSNNRYY